MNQINQDLQASHQILSLLERSKSQSEGILDRLSGAFAIVDGEGRILRTNFGLAQMMSRGPEEVIGMKVGELFRRESSQIFVHMLKSCGRDSGNSVEFELAINSGNDQRAFVWHVSRFGDGQTRGNLFAVIGQDISELRKAERELAEIFANVPLGILSFGNKGMVDARYSAFTEILFQEKSIKGTQIRDLIFGSHMEKLSQSERTAVGDLSNCVGQSDLLFDVIKSGLPKEVEIAPLQGSNEPRYVAMTFQPIAYSGKIERVLVVVEDRTSIVKARRFEEKAKLLEEENIARIVQIRMCAPEILPLLVGEIEQLFTRVVDLETARDRAGMMQALHGIKGNARIGGFSFLKEKAHEAEAILKPESTGEAGWVEAAPLLEGLRKEWQELRQMHRALSSQGEESLEESGLDTEIATTVHDLFAKYNTLLLDGISPESALIAERISLALRSFGFVTLKPVLEKLKTQAKKVADELGKKVKIEIDSAPIRVDISVRNAISESLLHLVTNALAHGVAAEGGVVKISIAETFGQVSVLVEDNGRGIPLEKVKSAAVKANQISLAKALSMPRKDALQLILSAKISTAEQVTEIAGRGVGMSAVVSSIAQVKGEITVDDSPMGGALFRIGLPTGETIKTHRTLVPANDLVRTLHRSIDGLGAKESWPIKQPAIADIQASASGLVYCDVPRLVLAVTTLLGAEIKGRSCDLDWKWMDDGRLQLSVNITGKDGQAKIGPEFSLPGRVCEDFLEQHGGSIERKGQQMTLSFGHRLGDDLLPQLCFGLDADVQPAQAEKTFERVSQVCKEWKLSAVPVWSAGGTTQPNCYILAFSGSATGRLGVTVAAPADVVKREILNTVSAMLDGGEKSWQKS